MHTDDIKQVPTDGSSLKSASPLPQRKTRSGRKFGGSPTDFFIISDEEIDLANSTVNTIGAEVLEQLQEVEDLRYKSKNLQGPISGRMRTLIDRMKKSVSMITSRYETTADVAYLRMRNREIMLKLKSTEDENEKLKVKLKNGKKKDFYIQSENNSIPNPN